MTAITREDLRQRADYTQKYNANTGRHGWLRLTPAYSVKIVEELLATYDQPQRILDPFSGTATTALSAAYHGHEGVTSDINPFLVWLGRAKTAHYSDAAIASTTETCTRVLDTVRRNAISPVRTPPIYNINRWWNAATQTFLCLLRAGIECESEDQSPERDLLLVAFCRTLIGLSNAAFNHQSMSFKNDAQLTIPLGTDMEAVFSEDLRFVLQGAQDNPRGNGQVLLGDAKSLANTVDGDFDLIITSPPYANRMSYVRELRPYMYWLGFLGDGRDAGELDWSAIGGTWGVATSRLLDWEQPSDGFTHPLLDKSVKEISHANNKNGVLLAKYVCKYFNDIWRHLNSLLDVVRNGSELHYIVGNSTFYGVLLPVEQLYAAMLASLGFENVRYPAIRKRNSKRELYEFDVSARWLG